MGQSIESLIERLPIGQKFASTGRTIGEGDFTLLHNLNWITAPLHSNREYMKTTQFGERVLSGACILSIMSGLEACTELPRVLWNIPIRVVAFLGLDEVRFKAPVLPGDTLTTEISIIDARVASKGDRGVMRRKHVGHKQTGEVVIDFLDLVLFEGAK